MEQIELEAPPPPILSIENGDEQIPNHEILDIAPIDIMARLINLREKNSIIDKHLVKEKERLKLQALILPRKHATKKQSPIQEPEIKDLKCFPLNASEKLQYTSYDNRDFENKELPKIIEDDMTIGFTKKNRFNQTFMSDIRSVSTNVSNPFKPASEEKGSRPDPLFGAVQRL